MLGMNLLRGQLFKNINKLLLIIDAGYLLVAFKKEKPIVKIYILMTMKYSLSNLIFMSRMQLKERLNMAMIKIHHKDRF
jgi:hypothetical protein